MSIRVFSSFFYQITINDNFAKYIYASYYAKEISQISQAHMKQQYFNDFIFSYLYIYMYMYTYLSIYIYTIDLYL